MSLPDLTNPRQQQAGVVVQKPKSDVYTMMLFITLVAIGLAITCLCIEMAKYDWDIKAEGAAVQERPMSALELGPQIQHLAAAPRALPAELPAVQSTVLPAELT